MDENISNFQGSVKMPNEIRNVKNTILFGLTGRQLGCASVSLITISIAVGILCGIFHINSTVAIIIGLLFASPSFALGFIRPGGIAMEDWLAIIKSNHIKSKPVRKLFAENSYEVAMRLGEKKARAEENMKKGKKFKKKDKAPKKKKPAKSAYKFRK